MTARARRAVVIPMLAAALVLALAPAPSVEWSPDRPVQGTLFTVRVDPGAEPVEAIEATFAGEPLHFEQDGGSYTALAAVPIAAAGTIPLHVRYHVHGEPVEREIPVRVEPGEYRMESLAVAPRFGREPDAALARRMADESRRAREVARRSHDTPRLWSPPLVLPRDSRVTSGFGDGREFNGRVRSRHMGVDFAGGMGAPVRAAARGVVALVDSFYLGGNVIYLDHGAGLTTAYLHLSREDVAVGDTVEAGQVIGRVGATGRVTGPHLHWIVRYGGITVDGRSLPGLEAADEN